jgi:hypothetical protein
MILSEPQKTALDQIKKIDEFESGRWFTQMELHRVTLHTMKALEDKGYVVKKEFPAMNLRYYQYTGKEFESNMIKETYQTNPDLFIEDLKKGAQELHDEILKNNLRTDPQWWKVRYSDFKKKYQFERFSSCKNPPMFSFWLHGNYYMYMVYDKSTKFSPSLNSTKETPDVKNLLHDLVESGIIEENGAVNYEIDEDTI